MSKLGNIFKTLDINTDNGLCDTNDTKWKSVLHLGLNISIFLPKTKIKFQKR